MTPPLLRALLFNRTDDTGLASAFPVRHYRWDPSHERNVDWVREAEGIRSSPVAAIRSVGGHGRASITATFDVPPGASRELRIRAVDRDGAELDLDPQTIPPERPTRAAVRFDLPPALAQSGVCHRTVRWIWEYADGQTPAWIPFAGSEHEVFVSLALPAPPWDGTAARGPLPWQETMEVACRWAAGTSDVGPCTTAIAQGIYSLGGQRILVGKSHQEPIRYSTSGEFVRADCVFDLSGFLRIAQLRPGAKTSFNCQDAATALALLASALGCALRVSVMYIPGAFDMITRTIHLFGEPAVQRTCFVQHEVVSAPGRLEDVGVWDPCLHIDLDHSPATNPPGTMGISAGIRMGEREEPLSYRDRLLDPGQDEEIALATKTGLRHPDVRPPSAPANDCSEDLPPYRRLREFLRGAPNSRGVPGTDANVAIFEALAAAGIAQEAAILRSGARNHVVLTVRLVPEDGAGLWQVSAVTARTRPQAVSLFLFFGSHYEKSLTPLRNVGDLALQNRAKDFVLLIRGRTVMTLHAPAGVDAPSFATKIDKNLFGQVYQLAANA